MPACSSCYMGSTRKCLTRRKGQDFGRDARGGVITLFALGLPVIAVLTTGAVELAEVVNARSKLQLPPMRRP